jgi:cytochrome P450 / NADPH-cytochrome P450 reductase
VTTFQKIPKYIDSTLAEKGAKAITSRGETDVALGTVFDDFDEWQDQHFWPALNSRGDNSVVTEVDSLDIEISTSARASHLNHRVQDALVLKNDILTAPGAAEKRHMEIKLPSDVTYQAGDYIAILPVNNIHLIERVLLRFSLPWDATMTINKGSHTTIPIQQSLSVTIVLGAYVEMTAPATRKNIATILQLTSDESIKSDITNSASATPTPSVLELLELYQSITIPFSVYLAMLPPMRIRQYSISSSPLVDPTVASITYAVLDEGQSTTTADSSARQLQNRKGRLGVATSFLRDLSPGSKIQIAIKKSHPSFHLPLDDASTPIIMVAAGTGISPFMGFIQERAVKIAAARERAKMAENRDFEKDGSVDSSSSSGGGLAPALLFTGCRSPSVDQLYKTQLEDWEKDGVVKMLPAFSQAPEQSAGCKYAQDRVWAERELVSRLFDGGARIYICGSGRLGRGVKDVAGRIYREAAGKKRREEMAGHDGVVEEITEEAAVAWWEGLRGERFAVDVFD